jgi:energy-coupling factor transporter ATP-binding protein EcfA2
MLTRIYIDNFRCFVNFEWKPGRKQLILGPNGSGKSSLLDALSRLRDFAIKGGIDDLHSLSQLTRWLRFKQSRQTFEIEAQLGHGTYVYRLEIEPDRSPEPQPRIVWEGVKLDGRAIFDFADGAVTLYTDSFAQKVTYPFDPRRSALATITSMVDNQKLTEFKLWFGGFQFFRINPFSMGLRAAGERYEPSLDLSNFAEWYRHLLQNFPRENSAFLESLRSVLDGFTFLKFMLLAGSPALSSTDVLALVAEFGDQGSASATFGFDELSEGQRCLICLYAILHFVVVRGFTVVLDEPENFVSLREIQPWLTAMADAVDEGKGQVLLISHHPEILNQWAPDFGVQFVREGVGPVRVREFQGASESSLTPAELVARGWELE